MATPVDVTVRRDDLTRGRRDGINRLIADLPDADVMLLDGLRVTTPARTVVDLARTQQRLLAVQLADWALTAGQCTHDDLVAVTSRMVRVPGVRAARAVTELAAVGVESPRETMVRLQIVDSGLPVPDVQLRIVDGGRLLARGDLGYWRWLIWIEYDGWSVHSSRDAFVSDRHRDRWLARRGWEYLRLSGDDVDAPRVWLEQLGQAIVDAPARIAAMDPRRSPEVAQAQLLAARAASARADAATIMTPPPATRRFWLPDLWAAS